MDLKVGNINSFICIFTSSFPYKRGVISDIFKDIFDRIKKYSIVKQNIFYRHDSHKKELLEFINFYSKAHFFSTTFICQPLADGMDIGIEIWAAPVHNMNHTSDICVFDSHFGRWGFISGIESDKHALFNRKIDFVFNKMNHILKKSGFEFKHLIRTWYYIGGILNKEGDYIRYEILNRIRNSFYTSIWNNNRKEYPASTGIGMNSDNIILDGICLIPNKDIKIIRLENPLQRSAFYYDMPIEKRPRFCRAIFVGNKNSCIVFVSGTASIRDSNVVYQDSIKEQTLITIENIKNLISRENLRKYGIEIDISLKDVKNIRVYLKKDSDYEIVKTICEDYFKDIPALYLVADICRSSLLVEIEAIIEVG